MFTQSGLWMLVAIVAVPGLIYLILPGTIDRWGYWNPFKSDDDAEN